jgi:hypothetical protein
MKTPIGIAIEMIDNSYSFNKERGHHMTCSTLSSLRNQLESLKETEKEQLIEARMNGYKDRGDSKEPITHEQWYTQTFNQ